MNAGLAARLRLIDFLLEHYGAVNRKHIADYFGVSTPQASLDFSAYQEFAPGNMEYDLRAKIYRRTEGFARRFP